MPIWLLSRGCYAVRILDLANVPSAKREPAIRLAISGWSPFTDTSHYIIPTDQGAILCAWDTLLTRQALQETGVSEEGISVVPETALRLAVALASRAGKPNEVYAHLTSSLDGYTGALLSANSILAEQWWPELPTPAHWQNFLRSAGLATSSETVPPEPQNTQWRSQASGYPANAQASNFSALEALVVWLVAFALTIPTVWYGNQLRQIYAAKQESRERLRQTEKDLDSVLNSREVALSTQDRAAKLADLLDQVDHLQVFALINDIVVQNSAPNTLQLNEWEVRPQLLKFSLVASTGTPPAATTFVKALERVPIFRDVEAKLDGSRINVTLKLMPGGKTSSQVPSPQPTPTNEAPLKKAAIGSSLVPVRYEQPRALAWHAIEATALQREA